MGLNLNNKWTLIKVALPLTVTFAFAINYVDDQWIDKSDDDIHVNFFAPHPDDDTDEFVVLRSRALSEATGDSIDTYNVIPIKRENDMIRVHHGSGWIEFYAPKHKKGMRK